MKKTFTPKKEDVSKAQRWHFFDASGLVLGDLAVQVSRRLIGKDKAIFTPNINTGDKVVVINASKIVVTGNKGTIKEYAHYTGYPGGLRVETLKHLFERRPNEVVKKAIQGMLPHNKLKKERMSNLYIYSESEHPHKAQEKVN